MSAEHMDFDAGIEHCPCGRVTANAHGLCNACTEDEARWLDESLLRAVDPNASAHG